MERFVETMSGQFQLTVSKDKMSLILNCPVVPFDPETTAEEIVTELEKMKISNPPEQGKILKMLMTAVEKNIPPGQMVLVRGKPPGKAVHGRTEWAGDYFNTGFVKDQKTGAINYRQRTAQSSVRADQLLGRRIPYRDGDTGVNIFGESVPGEKARVYYPSVGANVRLDQNSNSYYSQKNGRVRLLNDSLFVDEVFIIEGSIGIETGDLVHTGALVVKEDILEGSSVEAEGDIEVHGVIEAAHVKTGGNLIVRGGIIRCMDTKIRVAGTINAQFILDSDVEGGRDVLIEKEVTNTELKTFGSLIIPDGRIVGGRVAALRGINAGQVSTPASVHTELIVGENDILLNTLHALKHKINESDQKLTELNTMLFRQMHSAPLKSDEQRRKIKECQEAVHAEEKHKTALLLQSKKTWSRIQQLARKKIVVEKRLFPGTTLCLGEDKITVSESHTGPVTVTLKDGNIVIEGRPAVPSPADSG